MRIYLLTFLLTVIVVGCAQNSVPPAIPGISEAEITSRHEMSLHNPHKLWAAGNLYIDSNHEKFELVPYRMGGIHLNVLKFFEETCDDCVLITGALDKGDGTINLSMEITHPFPNHPELTVFDPKLILMFQGSHVIPDNMSKLPLYPLDYRLSWRLMGDPEILNADGYTYFWSPAYDSGFPNPIFNYWEGKYAFGGTPTANINGYLNFYSNETRHMLESGASVERIFHLSLPPGPIVAGYALDVCWEPPLVMPVMNPVDDFPITANQPELFYFKLIYNDGEVITDPYCCNVAGSSIQQGRVELDLWYQLPDAEDERWVGAWCEYFKLSKGGVATIECNSPDPEHIRCAPSYLFSYQPSGIYQVLGWESHYWTAKYPAFDVFEVVLDYE